MYIYIYIIYIYICIHIKKQLNFIVCDRCEQEKIFFSYRYISDLYSFVSVCVCVKDTC